MVTNVLVVEEMMFLGKMLNSLIKTVNMCLVVSITCSSFIDGFSPKYINQRYVAQT